MDYKDSDPQLKNNDDAYDLEQPFWADEFGERIQSGDMPSEEERLLQEELEADSVQPISDSVVAPATANDEEFHETLSDSNVGDQLEDDNLKVADSEFGSEYSQNSEDHESLGEKIREKFEDLRDRL